MPLKLIHGPPNSGRAGLIRRALRGGARARPGPGRADRRRRLRLRARALRGGRRAGRLGDDLRRRCSAPSRPPPGRPPAPSCRRPSGCGRSRSRSRRAAAGSGRCGARPRGPASPRAFERLLDELQAAGVEPGRGRGGRRDAGGLRLPQRHRHPLRRLRRGARRGSAASTAHGIAREAIALLRRDGCLLGRAAGLPLRARRPDPEPVRAGRGAGGADRGDGRAPLRGGQRGAGGAGAAARTSCASGSASPRRSLTEADPGEHRERRCSSTSRAASARRAPSRARPTASLVLLRSAGERGEAEAIARRGLEADRRRRRPGRDRDRPARPGAARAADRRGAGGQRDRRRRWRRSCRSPATAVGGALVALLEAEFGERPGAPTCCATCAGPRASPRAGRLAGARAAARPGRRDAETALELWQGEEGEPPRDLLRLREAAARSPAALAAEVGRLGGDDGVAAAARRGRRAAAGRGDGLELRAAGGDRRARSASWPSWASWRRRRRSWRRRSRELEFRVWSGPVEGRVRIASPYRLRAGALRPRLRRLAAGRRVPAPRPRRRPLPLRSPAGVARARAAPRQRGRGALPVRRLPRAAAPAPLPLLPRQRRERRRRGALAAARRGAALLAPPPDGDDPTRSRRRSPAAATWPGRRTRWPRRPPRTSWRGRWPPTGRRADAAALLAARRRRAEPRGADRRAARGRARAPRPPRARPGR